MSELFSELDPKVAQALGRAVEKLRADLEHEIGAAEASSEAEPAAAGADSLEELRHAVARVDRAGNQAEALSALLEGACRFCSRAALFTLQGDGLQGWDGRGFEGAKRSITGQELPSPNGSLAAKLTAAGGLMALSESDCAPLCEALGVDAPAVGALIPLQLGERVAAGLYADRLEGAESLDLSALQLLTYCAGQVVETLPLRGRAETATLRIAGDAAAAVEAPAAPAEPAQPVAPEPAAEPTEAAVEEAPEPAAAEEVAAEPAADSPALAEPEPEPQPTTETAPEPPAAEPEPQEPDVEPAAAAPEAPAAAVREPQPEEPASEAAAPAVTTTEDDAAPTEADSEGESESDTAAVFHDPSLEEQSAPAAPAAPAADDSPPQPDAEEPAAAEPEPPAADGSGIGFDVAPGQASPKPAQPAAPPPTSEPVPLIDKSSTLVQPPEDHEGPGWAFTTQKISTDLGNEARVEEARRLARLLVTEIKLYNEDQVEAGRRHNDIYQRLKEDIERSRQIFEDRIDDEVRARHDYFGEAMVKILAGGNAESLGR